MADTLTTEKLLRIIAENTGKRISLSLEDLELYMAVARAAITEARRSTEGEISLPELPRNYGRFNINGPDEYRIRGWTAEQMQEYARAAIAADRQARQGEPVAWEVGLDLFRSYETACRSVRNPDLKPEPLYRAATKAAAPADAPMVDNVLDADAERKKYAEWQRRVEGRTSTDGFEVWLAAKVAAWLDAPCRVPAEDARKQLPDFRMHPAYQVACKMGNTLYNLGQHDDLPARWREACRELVAQWDAARRAAGSDAGNPTSEAILRELVELRALKAEHDATPHMHHVYWMRDKLADYEARWPAAWARAENFVAAGNPTSGSEKAKEGEAVAPDSPELALKSAGTRMDTGFGGGAGAAPAHPGEGGS